MDIVDLLDILKNKRLILRDPQSWDDRNDYFLIQQYLENKNLKNVYVSCFTVNDDAYHFWKIYTNRASGVCVKFKTQGLVDSINLDRYSSNFRLDVVKYRTLRDVTQTMVEIEEYPFIKRVAFRAEEEVRILCEEPKSNLPYRTLKIDLDLIEEIVIGPSLRDEYAEDCINLIKSIRPIDGVKVRKSTILQSAAWQRQMA